MAEPIAREIIPIPLEEEMKQSYLDYAMSVIVGRALPDVRDGLKPVQRRILYSMYGQGNFAGRPFKKSARIVGDTIGRFHPHGDAAVYEALVRMAQDFTMRYPLVEGQGNFGSIDGDPPAAMRYTEVRLAPIAHELLTDIERETVDFRPNYDASEQEPEVLPARIPNLLINGAAGIAVGLATNIPPHNLGEIVDGLLALIDNPEITLEELMEHIPGPDFPTGAIINGTSGIREAYRTGRGSIVLRACAHIEKGRDGKKSIVITELPYQVNKARLLEKIAELVKEGRLTGIAAIRDESDKEGMRIVIELKRGEPAEVILNNLYQHTPLETTFGCNFVALVGGMPRRLGLKELLEAFLDHRREVVTRRTLYELRKARERVHLLEGLTVALVNLDKVVEKIRQAETAASARAALLEKVWPVKRALVTAPPEARPEDLEPFYGLGEEGYRLSPKQVQAILDLRLHRLTGLEREKIAEEYQTLLKEVEERIAILESDAKLMAVIREELVALKEAFGDPRKTEILEEAVELHEEDLIAREEAVVTLTHAGYIKWQPLSGYRAQRRGGRGKVATRTKEQDDVEHLVLANTHDTILFFTDQGRVYALKVYKLPSGARGAKGRPLVNLLPLAEEEKISAILPLRGEPGFGFVFFATAGGMVKKTPLEEYQHIPTQGKIAIRLKEGDLLVDVALTDGQREILLFSSSGRALRFEESEVRSMGRDAAGVRGMKLREDDRVVGMVVSGSSPEVLIVTEKGYGKRTRLEEFPKHHRSGQGVIAIKLDEKTGKAVRVVPVNDDDELILVTSGGTLVRIRAEEVSTLGRYARGVILIRLAQGERVAAADRIAREED